MARKKHPRKIVTPPRFKSYKPILNSGEAKGSVDLLYEEYEALKLADYELLTHEEAGQMMGISRATFARIYESARRKIALALVEQKEIVSVYGNVEYSDEWTVCNHCSARFSIMQKGDNSICPICGNDLK